MDKKGFTMIEVLVTTTILGVLSGLLFPAAGKAREQGRRIRCLNNLRQHGIAWYLYLEDRGEYFPFWGSPSQGGTDLYSFGGKKGSSGEGEANERVLNRYLEVTDDESPSASLFYCPDDETRGDTPTNFDEWGNSYWLNDKLIGLKVQGGEYIPRPLSSVTRPRNKVYLENDDTYNNKGHGGKGYQPDNKIPVMVLFVDGHAAGPFLYKEDFDSKSQDMEKKVWEEPNDSPTPYD